MHTKLLLLILALLISGGALQDTHAPASNVVHATTHARAHLPHAEPVAVVEVAPVAFFSIERRVDGSPVVPVFVKRVFYHFTTVIPPPAFA